MTAEMWASRFLGRFQRLAAFQTTSLVAWGDQPAKRAHPLRHETRVLWLSRCGHFGEPIPKPSARTVAEAMKVGCHGSTLYPFSGKWAGPQPLFQSLLLPILTI